MKKLLTILLVITAINLGYGQSVGYLRNDTTIVTNINKNANFVIESSTKGVLGGLWNIGNGRTIFKIPLITDISGLQSALNLKLNKADSTGVTGYQTVGNFFPKGDTRYAKIGGGTLTNAITFNDSGSGAASGTTYNNNSARTISYNTIGAQPTLGYTAENIANKTATQSSSTTTYPNWLGVTNYLSNFLPLSLSSAKTVNGNGNRLDFTNGDGTNSSQISSLRDGAQITGDASTGHGFLGVSSSGIHLQYAAPSTETTAFDLGATASFTSPTGKSAGDAGHYSNRTANSYAPDWLLDSVLSARAPTKAYIDSNYQHKNIPYIYNFNFTGGALPTGVTLVNPGSLTVSYTGGAMNITGTPNNYANYVKDNIETGLKTLTFERKIVYTGSVTFFVGLQGTYDYKAKIAVSGSGVTIGSILNSTGSAVQTATSTVLIPTSGDTLKVVWQLNGNAITTSVSNVSRQQQSLTDTYTYNLQKPVGTVIPTIGYPVIGLYSGTLHLAKWKTIKPTGPVIHFANSIGTGYQQNSISQTYPYLLEPNPIVIGSPGSRADQMIAVLPELLSLIDHSRASTVIIELGGNEAIQGASSATYTASMVTIADSVKAHGAATYALNIPPIKTTANNVDSYNAALASAAGNHLKIIDINSPLMATTGTKYNPAYCAQDTIHPNGPGGNIIANTIQLALPGLKFKNPIPQLEYHNNVVVGYGGQIPGLNIDFPNPTEAVNINGAWQSLGSTFWRSKAFDGDGAIARKPFTGMKDLDSTSRGNLIWEKGRYSPTGLSNVMYDQFYGDAMDVYTPSNTLQERTFANGQKNFYNYTNHGNGTDGYSIGNLSSFGSFAAIYPMGVTKSGTNYAFATSSDNNDNIVNAVGTLHLSISNSDKLSVTNTAVTATVPITAPSPTYSTGGYDVLVRNQISGIFEIKTSIVPVKYSYSGTVTGQSVFTVTIPTQPGTSYTLSGGIAPTNSLVAGVGYSISNKTTTSFDVTFITPLTGSVSFEGTIQP